MKLKMTWIFILALDSLNIIASGQAREIAKKPIYLNTAYSFKERAADLVSRMTPEEK